MAKIINYFYVFKHIQLPKFIAICVTSYMDHFKLEAKTYYQLATLIVFSKASELS